MEFVKFASDVDYRLYIILIMHHELWGYKVEEKLRLGVLNKKY
jgi:hypothetical protein